MWQNVWQTFFKTVNKSLRICHQLVLQELLCAIKSKNTLLTVQIIQQEECIKMSFYIIHLVIVSQYEAAACTNTLLTRGTITSYLTNNNAAIVKYIRSYDKNRLNRPAPYVTATVTKIYINCSLLRHQN